MMAWHASRPSGELMTMVIACPLLRGSNSRLLAELFDPLADPLPDKCCAAGH